VISFIKDHSAFNYFAHEEITHCQTLLNKHTQPVITLLTFAFAAYTLRICAKTTPCASRLKTTPNEVSQTSRSSILQALQCFQDGLAFAEIDRHELIFGCLDLGPCFIVPLASGAGILCLLF